MDPGDGCSWLVPGRDHAAEAAPLQAGITVQDVRFWPIADMTGCRCPLFRSLLGVKQTSLVAAHMSACDPKRTGLPLKDLWPDLTPGPFQYANLSQHDALSLASGEAMRRRDFIAGLTGAAALPLVARAQERERMRRIGVLLPAAADDPEWQAWLGVFL